MMDRRAVFFLCSAVLCLVLTIVTPEELRWVGYTLAVGYTVLAGASYLDFASRQRGNR
jgi:hypothetical protein